MQLGDYAMKYLFIVIYVLVNLQTDLLADDLSKDILVYKSPECSCCKRWVQYLKKHDYNVTLVETRNVLAEKDRLGVPPKIAACHTAVIDGYVIEGHVTHRDIKRLLLFRPKIKGIAVPGMPIGTPGMEEGDYREPYNVMSFDEEGRTKIFVKH